MRPVVREDDNDDDYDDEDDDESERADRRAARSKAKAKADVAPRRKKKQLWEPTDDARANGDGGDGKWAHDGYAELMRDLAIEEARGGGGGDDDSKTKTKTKSKSKSKSKSNSNSNSLARWTSSEEEESS